MELLLVIWANPQTIISPYIKHRAARMELLPVMDKSSNYNFAIAKLSVGYCMLSPSIKLCEPRSYIYGEKLNMRLKDFEIYTRHYYMNLC
jgi:hypothetical protein